MSVTYTEEQARAISARGQIIVSASAGSGKTFVMIERLVKLILEGADVREVLAVTFTNKAAAQMREKLRNALYRKISQAEAEERERLKGQLNYLPIAEISTLHAFCGRLVRSYFYLAGVDPAFRIISPDDADGREISERAISETFETLYKEKDGVLFDLLSVYFRSKRDSRLREIILSLHRKYRGIADYQALLKEVGTVDLFDDACRFLYGDFQKRIRFFSQLAWQLLERSEDAQPRAVAEEIKSACEALLQADGLFSLISAARFISLTKRLPASTKYAGEKLVALKKLSALSKELKDLLKQLKEFETEKIEYARYQDGATRAKALATLVLRYDETYARIKREKGLLDYDDLEHCALKVLEDKEAYEAIKAKFRYVFVDEYQDVNPAQEKLISLLSGEEVFLVGDRKQSIYNFRGSKAEYFTKKTESLPTVLHLTRNFRSAASVIDAVNRIFDVAMQEDTCGFSYADGGIAQGGERYGEWSGGVFFHRFYEEKGERNSPSEVYSVLSEMKKREKKTAEQNLIVSVVKGEVGKTFYDVDAGQERVVSYGDIAILVRKNTGEVGKIVSALSDAGIPVATTSKVNVCNFWEVRMLLDWLSYLDNAEQDIPMTSAMLSAVGGFCEEELAQIRLRFPSAYSFREACTAYAEKMQDSIAKKLNRFFATAKRLRGRCAVHSAKEILYALLAEGLEAEILSRKDGQARLNRARRVLAEATGTVHEFLTRVARLGEEIFFSEAGGQDAVQVVTMHASKGLEYPVVILSNMETEFHGADHDDVMWTEQFSVAPRCFDVARKFTYETVLRRAAACLQEEEERKGEINLLYVAMTRAKYRLHVMLGESPRALDIRRARRFSDLIDPIAIAPYFVQDEEREIVSLSRRALVYRTNEEEEKRILSAFARKYPYQASVDLPVKSSATELMQALRAERTDSYFHMTGEVGSSAEEGTAYHLFLEHVDFSSNAEHELNRMKEEGIFTPEQLALLSVERLEKMMALPCLRALAGKRVWREQKFLVSLQADEITPIDSSDEMVFQGAIDLLCEDENGYTVIDYKYSSHDDVRIQKDYAVQIQLYKKAVARAMRVDERTVRARIINVKTCREILM